MSQMVAEYKTDLPSDTEAEELLIGCLLVDSRRFHEIASVVGPADFWDDQHREVFEVIAELVGSAAADGTARNDRCPLDPKPINDRLKANGRKVRLADYSEAIGTGWDYKYYANRIGDMSRRRAIVLAAHDMQRDARSPREATKGIVEATLRRAAELNVGAGAGNRLRTIGQVVRDELLPLYERTIYGDGPPEEAKINTGWYCVDSLLGGFHAGGLITIAGRTGQGKTTFASNVAAYASLQLGKRVLFVTLEQPQREIAESVWRSLADVGGFGQELSVDEKRYRFSKMLDCLDAVSGDNLLLYDGSAVTVEEIASVARMQAATGLDMVVIDYLGLVKKRPGNEPVTYKIEHITTSLKDLAKQLNVPILLLCQMSRAFDQDSDEEPQLHHLRDSGAIEQDSDAVIFVWRPKNGETAHVKVGKNRHGVVGKTELLFLGACKKFVEKPVERNSQLDEWNQS